MEVAYTFILLFITLLPLCRAELSGSWYSANVINNGEFSPKPISELFSTEPPPFSSINPIVVLSQSTTPSTPISTSVPPGSSSFSTAALTPEFESTYSTTPSTIQTQSQTSYIPSSSLSTQQTYSQSTFPSSSLSTQQPYSPSTFPSSSFSTQQPYSPSTFPSSSLSTQQPYNNPSTFLERKPDFDLGNPFQFHQNKPNPYSPNYFMIYQQSQNLPPTGPQQTLSTFQPSSSFDPSSPMSTFSTFAPEVSSIPSSTQSSSQPEISSISTTVSTMQPETSTPQSTLFFTPSSESTFPPNLPSSPQTRSPTTSTQEISTQKTPPCNVTGATPVRTSFDRFPTLRIRMVAPSGSITNVNINPIVSTTTTRRPTTKRTRTTTTRKPTTTRTKRTKKNRNSFDGCTRTCQERGRNPICAAPLAQIPVNPDTLKGFPSVCHMACHNSFKKDQYEMLVEGRCGKLRTRIRTVDSDKLKRVELNKAQYTVIDGPQTVLEFSSLPR